MLAYYLNDEPFALDRSKSVRLNWRNPACNFTEFPGDVGLGIEIPVNEINRALLGNPERFERYEADNNREFERFKIKYGGVLLMGGTLVIQTANHEIYSGWLRSDVGNIGKEHREKFIFDSSSFFEEKKFENKSDYDPLTDDYGCPMILNPEFFTEKGKKVYVDRLVENPNYEVLSFWQNIWHKQEDPYITESVEVEDLTEAFMRHGQWFVNAKNNDNSIKAPESECHAEKIAEELQVCVVSPMLFLNFLLKSIIKDCGFYLNENFIANDPDLQKLILYNNFDITRMTYYTTLTVWEEQQWYDEFIRKALSNPVDKVKRDYGGTFLYKNLIPQIRLKDFLLSIQNLLNVCFFFRPGRKIIDIVDREEILTGNAIDLGKYMTGFWEMGDKKDVTLKFTFDHDDKDTYFAERWENIDDRRDDEREAIETWNDLEAIENPKMGEIRYIKDQNIYVQYNLIQYEENDPITGESIQRNYVGWDHLAYGLQNGYYNYSKDETEEIPTKFSTIVGEQNAVTYQRGNIKSQLFAYESFSTRLMFYLGNNEARYETDNISLDWEKKDKGLLETRWKNWARFWATRQPVNCEAHLPLNMLSYVINNITGKFRTREGEFIIEQLETEFSINSIGTSKIKGYKYSYSPKVYGINELWKVSNMIQIDNRVDWLILDFINI